MAVLFLAPALERRDTPFVFLVVEGAQPSGANNSRMSTVFVKECDL